MNKKQIQSITQAPLPTFIVIGAMRAGTTSLHYNLARHPDILMSKRKETNFFSDDAYWQEGSAWYGKQFRKTTSRCIGESSPSYTRRPIITQTAKRMHQLLPDLRLIYLVRSPLERSMSHFFHHMLMEGNSKNLEKSFSLTSPVVTQSLYGYQLALYQRHYADSRIKVVVSEELFQAPRRAMSSIFEFLNIKSNFYHPDFAIPQHSGLDLPPVLQKRGTCNS